MAELAAVSDGEESDWILDGGKLEWELDSRGWAKGGVNDMDVVISSAGVGDLAAVCLSSALVSLFRVVSG